MLEFRKVAIALAVVLAAAGARAQDLSFADPEAARWAGEVRDRLATRDSLEGVYQRTSSRAAALEQEMARLRAARPGPGQDPAAFQYQVQARAAQIRSELAQSQTVLSRTQQRLDPVYTALRRDAQYASQHQDAAVRQSVGSLIATAGHGLDPIWIRIPQVYQPAAGGAAAVAGSSPSDGTNAGSMAIALSGSARNVPAASATRAALPSGAIWTMEADATGVMMMHARDAVTKQKLAGVAPLPTGVSAGADAAVVGAAGGAEAPRTLGQLRRSAWVAEPATDGSGTVFRAVDWKTRQPIEGHQTLASTAAPQAGAAGAAANAAGARPLWTMEADGATGLMQMVARDPITKAKLTDVAPVATGIRTGTDATSVAEAGRTLGQLRRSAWVAEPASDGSGTTFRSVDWKTRAPIDAHEPVVATGTSGASAPAASGGSSAAAATASRLPVRTPQEMSAAVWTAEANPATGTMVLRARDAVSNNHLAGYRPIETSIPNPVRGEAAASSGATRAAMRDVVYRAAPDAQGRMVFTPESRSGAALPEGIRSITQEATAASRTAGARGPSAASETASAEAAAAEGAATRRGFKMPDLKTVATSAAKWGGLSIGITLASNVATQLVQNKGKVNWGQATDFLTDKHFWGGTAGGFVGAMAGGAIAAAVPGGPFVKALLSIGGASLGQQIGSGQAGKLDWMQLGVTTVGAAAGTALGMSVGGPVGALIGGIAGQMVSQFVYDKLKEARERMTEGPVARNDQAPYPQQQLPPGLPGPIPGQVPGGVGQMPPGVGSVSQMPAQDPAALEGSIAQLTQRLQAAYQEKLAADQSGNQGLAYQKALEYQSLHQRLEALRRAAYQNGAYGDYRYSR